MQLMYTLKRSALLYGDTPAIVDSDGRWTYTELLERVQKTAGMLQGLGVGADDMVAILMLNSHWYLELMFGGIWAGGVIVPRHGPASRRWRAPSSPVRVCSRTRIRTARPSGTTRRREPGFSRLAIGGSGGARCSVAGGAVGAASRIGGVIAEDVEEQLAGGGKLRVRGRCGVGCRDVLGDTGQRSQLHRCADRTG